jgi:hypothetical protein
MVVAVAPAAAAPVPAAMEAQAATVVLAVLPAAKAAQAVTVVLPALQVATAAKAGMVVLPAPPAVMVRAGLLAQLVRVLLAVPPAAMVMAALLVPLAVMVTDMVPAQGTLPRVKETIARLQRPKAREMIVLLPKDIPPMPRIALHLQWPPFAQ